jgi:hypothetical protein
VSPSTLLRTVSLSNGLSNGSWTFYEAINFDIVNSSNKYYIFYARSARTSPISIFLQVLSRNKFINLKNYDMVQGFVDIYKGLSGDK